MPLENHSTFRLKLLETGLSSNLCKAYIWTIIRSVTSLWTLKSVCWLVGMSVVCHNFRKGDSENFFNCAFPALRSFLPSLYFLPSVTPGVWSHLQVLWTSTSVKFKFIHWVFLVAEHLYRKPNPSFPTLSHPQHGSHFWFSYMKYMIFFCH